MKVLQTIGVAGSSQTPGIFMYRRTPSYVEIYDEKGQNIINVSNDDWRYLLRFIKKEEKSTFQLSRGDHSLYEILRIVSTKRSLGWNDFIKARIIAIMEHEGSIDHHGGNAGAIMLINAMS